MVDRLRFGRCCQPTLTVEPGFTSSGHMEQLHSDRLLPIGELARRAGVATSTVRYYERLGLLRPDGREMGQRRYRRHVAAAGVHRDAWRRRPVARRHRRHRQRRQQRRVEGHRQAPAALAGGADRAARTRGYLEGALLCRFDHPLTDCSIMGAEIDRRLAEPAPGDR